MEENQFQELLEAVQSSREVDTSFIEATLKELVNTEFREIKARKIKVKIKDLGRAYAKAFSHDGIAYIYIDPKSYRSLKEILRHELLHIELGGLSDEDPIFKAEARRRGIDIWCV